MSHVEKKVALSSEQLLFIEKSKEGYNILVDACIGSGKTTAIQHLCDELPSSKKILYLTYNRLLKLDAKAKIKNVNATVNNYHGFAFAALKRDGVTAGVSDLVQVFNYKKPVLNCYDILIIDEYQDIEKELADMLLYIKSSNSAMQIIAVGDMEQKIYDKTTLSVLEFMEQFLGVHIKLEFTRCFRLSEELATKLGRIWHKSIVGVNANCIVEEMDLNAVAKFLSEQKPRDILCLGKRTGELSKTLNRLEQECPDKFNKNTVYASILDSGDGAGATKPRSTSAIFTTFDSSKGLERKICVVFDWTESYWEKRISKPQQSYEILRNIFCVAASRGKERIVFVNSGEATLSEQTISTELAETRKFEDVNISEMFDHKYREDVEKCYSLLQIKLLSKPEDASIIKIKNYDGLIDLSPCIGMYQESVFFKHFDIEKAIELHFKLHGNNDYLYTEKMRQSSIDEKILFLTSLETSQNRYRNQVNVPFVSDSERQQLVQRLGLQFSANEIVQTPCAISFSDTENGKPLFAARGLTDAIKDDVVYELKFVSELAQGHFLQCACYMVALGLQKGILWNVRTNKKYEIMVPNESRFLDAVTKAISKGLIKKYYEPRDGNCKEYFAVIDTETNYRDEVMSIGVVIASSDTFEFVSKKYYIIAPEYKVGGMYSSAIHIRDSEWDTVYPRAMAICDLRSYLESFQVNSIFAYNASFDYRHLPELASFEWRDIMRLAAYRQHNHKIPQTADCHGTGRLKRDYGVEPILRLLLSDSTYCEKHNALIDAFDELRIMKLLKHGLNKYEPMNKA